MRKIRFKKRCERHLESKRENMFSGLSFWPALQDIAWRLAPVSNLSVVVLTILALKMYFDLGWGCLDTFMAELEKLSLSELLGLYPLDAPSHDMMHGSRGIQSS
jgi:hypothetical protein